MRAIIDDIWQIVTIIIIISGFITNSFLLVMLGVIIPTSVISAKWWAKISLNEIIVSQTLSKQKLFEGESTTLILNVQNAKWFPVPWLELKKQIPRDLQIDGPFIFNSSTNMNQLLLNASLRKDSQMTWEIEIYCARRGIYRIGQSVIKSGDFFGLYENEKNGAEQSINLVVYPQIYEFEKLSLESLKPFGDLRGKEVIFQDTSQLIGIRDYHFGDPMKHIDWKASARSMKLQSRVFAPSGSYALVIALDISTFSQSWKGSDPILVERAISAAASIAKWGEERGYDLGLISNDYYARGRAIRVAVGRHPERLSKILEALAAVDAFTGSSLANELNSVLTGGLPMGTTVVVIAALMSEDLADALLKLVNDRHQVYVLKTSSYEWHENLWSIPVIDISRSVNSINVEKDTVKTL
ncbi:MAG: DUF58 domain-containing protein [Dehalococcoidia bacterium]|nr:DUF58 domain-containing protein [Dehalococcoidia bacterium]